MKKNDNKIEELKSKSRECVNDPDVSRLNQIIDEMTEEESQLEDEILDEMSNS